jgi:tetratricopeptide (TPR) repeat protein
MRVKCIIGISVIIVGVLGVAMSGWGQKHKASPEITESLKKAYAHYCQGQYEQALALALPLYQKDPDIWVAWFPTWVYRVAKGPVPNPYHKSTIMRMTIESHERGRPFNLSAYCKTANAAHLTARAYSALGRYQEALPIYEEIRRKVGNAPASMPDDVGMCRRLIAQGHRPPQPPAKSTWKPLTLRFQEEDYFVLVPVDEASQLFGMSSSVVSNPKVVGGKGIRVTAPGQPNVVWRFFIGRPIVERLENGKGNSEGLFYATVEKEGKVWVPFYWLARKAGVKWWEVRNGKIYVAPREGSGQGTVPSQKTTTAGSR